MKLKALPVALFVNALLAPAAFNYVSDIAGNPLVGFCTETVVVGGTIVGALLATKMHLDR